MPASSLSCLHHRALKRARASLMLAQKEEKQTLLAGVATGCGSGSPPNFTGPAETSMHSFAGSHRFGRSMKVHAAPDPEAGKVLDTLLCPSLMQAQMLSFADPGVKCSHTCVHAV